MSADYYLAIRRGSVLYADVCDSGLYLYDIDEGIASYHKYLHLGKSSSGWVFSLTVYPKINVLDIDSWILFLKNYSSYDYFITDGTLSENYTSFDAFSDVISRQSNSRITSSDFNHYFSGTDFDWEMFWSQHPRSSDTTFSEYLKVNCAQTAPLGLLALRPSMKNSNFYCSLMATPYGTINCVSS